MDNQFDWLYFLTILNEDRKMKTIGASKFKERCLSLLDSLDHDGLVITKHGKPIAHLIPFRRKDAELIGSLSHKIEVVGDILCTGADWDADPKS